jgi:hypothetical protein
VGADHHGLKARGYESFLANARGNRIIITGC